MHEFVPYQDIYAARNGDGPCRFDNTRLSDYGKCARFFRFRHCYGWSPDRTAAPLSFGGAMHKALEDYYKLFFFGDGRPYDPMVLAKTAWESFRDHYEAEIPISMQQEPRTSDKAFEILKAYAKQYAREEFTIERPEHIEIGFSAPLPDCEDVLIGRCDAVVKHPNLGYAILEHKTAHAMGKPFLAMFRPNNQVSGYIYGARFDFPKVYGALINGIQVAKTKGDLLRVPTSRTDAELVDYAQQIVWKIKRIREDKCWNQETTSCTYYGKCTFHDICFSGKPLSVWEERREDPPGGFTVDFWEPWKVEGHDLDEA